MRMSVARLASRKAAIVAATLFAATISLQTYIFAADGGSTTNRGSPSAGTIVAAPTASTPPATAPAAHVPATGPVATPPLNSGNISVPVPSEGTVTTSGSKSKAPHARTKAKKVVHKKHKVVVGTASFIGQIAASEVNVRSGPRLAYYPVGQLTRGQLVKVVGTVNSWDRIAAPAGTRCYIARQFVRLSADGTTGHVSADYVYLRAASPLTPASHYAVVGLVRRGTHVSITGSTKEFYVIRPPHGTDFYVAGQFVKPAPANSTYITSQISMPPGFKGPGLPTNLPNASAVAVAPATTATAANSGATAGTNSANNMQVVPVPSAGGNSSNTPATSETAAGAGGAGGLIPVIPGVGKAVSVKASVPIPSVKINTNAYAEFSALNRKAQKEFRKPVLQRKLKPLLADYQNLARQPNLPPSVKQGTAEWIKEVKKGIEIQALASTAANTPAINKVIAPYQQKWEQSQNAVNEAVAHAPYLAKGILKTSTAIHDYALVSPVTGRVVAYLNPTSKIDISKLLGSYVGVKGVVEGKTGITVRVIDVYTATMLPVPRAADQTPPGEPSVP